MGNPTTLRFRERGWEILQHGRLDGFQLAVDSIQTVLSQKSHRANSSWEQTPQGKMVHPFYLRTAAFTINKLG